MLTPGRVPQACG